MSRIALEQALRLLTAGIEPVGIEEAALVELPLGRTLARPITAALDQPPFHRSPLDGYALHAADTLSARRERPVVLPVTGIFCAGDAPAESPVERGQAVRIMTGAPIPAGCDCVVAQEQTDGGEERVRLFTELRPFQNFVRKGEDFHAGDLLLAGGMTLTPAALGIAAAAGLERIVVYRRPKVALVATGDELLEPGQPLLPGKIYNSNLLYLRGRLVQWGVQIVSAHQVGDDAETISRAILRGREEADLVLTTGGVSVGQKDLLPRVMERLGADRVFHGVEMKPGSPALFCRLGGVPVLCLSGNPFAAAATLEVLARPLILALTGGGEQTWRRAVLLEKFPKGSHMPRFLRGRWEDGRLTIPKGHSSGRLFSMLGCNCLAELPATEGPVPAGTELPILLL